MLKLRPHNSASKIHQLRQPRWQLSATLVIPSYSRQYPSLDLPCRRFLSTITSPAESLESEHLREGREDNEITQALRPGAASICEEVAASRKESDGEGAVFVDATVGHAGHAEALLRVLPRARLVGLDADGEMAAKASRALLAAGVADRATIVKAPFSHLPQVLAEAGVASVDGVLADIGFNSGHVANAARGFAFRKDGRLDGRFDSSIQGSTSIADIVNKCSFGQLVSILRHKGGETKHERAIARAIVEWRGKGARKRRIASTLELRFVIESAIAVALGEPPIASSRADARFAQRQAKHSKAAEFKRKGRMPGTWDRESVWVTKADQDKLLKKLAATKPRYTAELQRAFQAFRMVVNAEDWHVAQLLQSLPQLLSPNGRFACMVFAPHEDHMLRTTAQAYSAVGWNKAEEEEGLRPHPKEVRANPRSRSARLHTLVAPSHRASEMPLSATGFNLDLEPYLMPQTLSLRRPLPPGGAQSLLGAYAVKAAKDAARSGGLSTTPPAHDSGAGSDELSNTKRITLEDVQGKLAGGVRSVEFVSEDGYSSGDWSPEGEPVNGSDDSDSVEDNQMTGREWESDEGDDLDAQEEEELMFTAMTQSLRVTLSDSHGAKRTKIVTVSSSQQAPQYVAAPEHR